MLKLERDKDTRQVCIRVAKGETLFTKLFLTALIVALSLHAAFFLIFRIDQGHENYRHFVLPPVSVQAIPKHPEPSEQYSLTEYEARVLAKQSIYEPKPSPITVPPISSHPEQEIIYPGLPSNEPTFFSQLETEYLLNELHPIDLAVPMQQVEVYLSGPIVENVKQTSSHPLLEEITVIPIHQIEQKRYLFDVIVDAESGKIIWYEKQQDSPEELEDLLLALNFELIDRQKLMMKGHVEILTTERLREHD